MKTVGEILKEARCEKQIGFEEAETSTKIRHEFLQAIEENNFNKLPDFTTAQGFVKNYAEFLGLSAESALAVFRRDFAQKQPQKLLPVTENKYLNWLKNRGLLYLRSNIWLIILILIILFYFLFQFWHSKKASLWYKKF